LTQLVLVVGAGVAAFAAAIRCARQGLNVKVLLPARRQWPEFPETLSAGGFRTLLQLGLQRNELAQSFPEVRERRSRWGDGPVQVKSRVPGLQGPVILGKSSLINMLREAAVESGAQVLEVERLITAKESASGMLVSFLAAGATQELACGYAIDASGRPAVLARLLGTKRVTLDDLVAFITHGPAQPEFAACVATVSVADGWTFWASDQLGQASFTFFTAGRKFAGQLNARHLITRMPEEIHRMTASPDIWAESRVDSSNCSTSVLEQSGGMYWLACGDALQTFDPLASTGVATALQQADGAAQAIASAIGGDRSLIASYRKQAQISFRRYTAERNAYYGVGTGELTAAV
jgi:flavin-dependent dehydrogenase